jgi:hypothetical protein
MPEGLANVPGSPQEMQPSKEMASFGAGKLASFGAGEPACEARPAYSAQAAIGSFGALKLA